MLRGILKFHARRSLRVYQIIVVPSHRTVRYWGSRNASHRSSRNDRPAIHRSNPHIQGFAVSSPGSFEQHLIAVRGPERNWPRAGMCADEEIRLKCLGGTAKRGDQVHFASCLHCRSSRRHLVRPESNVRRVSSSSGGADGQRKSHQVSATAAATNTPAAARRNPMGILHVGSHYA